MLHPMYIYYILYNVTVIEQAAEDATRAKVQLSKWVRRQIDTNFSLQQQHEET